MDPYLALTLEPSHHPSTFHEVTVAAPTPPDNPVARRSLLIIIGISVVIALIAVLTGWWRQTRRVS